MKFIAFYCKFRNKLFIFFVMTFVSINVSAQSIESKVLEWYAPNKTDSSKNNLNNEESINYSSKFNKKVLHKIDPIHKLKNNNYVACVYNYEEGAAGGTSATFDFLEIHKIDSSFDVFASILDIGKDMGGSGVALYRCKTVLLPEDNYLTILLTKRVHHGIYLQLTIILNSNKILFDEQISGDRFGITGIEKFDSLIKIETDNNLFKSLVFKSKKLVSINEKNSVKETTYQLLQNGIDFNINSIIKINVIKCSTHSVKME